MSIGICEVCKDNFTPAFYDKKFENLLCPKHRRELLIYLNRYFNRLLAKIEANKVICDNFIEKEKEFSYYDSKYRTFIDSKILDEDSRIFIIKKVSKWIEKHKQIKKAE